MWRVDAGGLKNNPGTMMRLQREGNFPVAEADEPEISFSGPVRVDLEFHANKNFITAIGIVQAIVKLNCSLCLETFELKMEAPFEETYYYTGEGESDWILFSGDLIDLEPEIIKSVLLEAPMKILCSKDCRGLCASCGQNLNKQDCNCSKSEIDPRLASLKELFKN